MAILHKNTMQTPASGSAFWPGRLCAFWSPWHWRCGTSWAWCRKNRCSRCSRGHCLCGGGRGAVPGVRQQERDSEKRHRRGKAGSGCPQGALPYSYHVVSNPVYYINGRKAELDAVVIGKNGVCIVGPKTTGVITGRPQDEWWSQTEPGHKTHEKSLCRWSGRLPFWNRCCAKRAVMRSAPDGVFRQQKRPGQRAG